MARRTSARLPQVAMHENDFWIPTTDYKDQCVYIIGGGPSVNDCDLTLLGGRNVIAINSSAYKVLEAKIPNSLLYFTDSGWWRNNEEIARAWPGKVVTLSGVAKREYHEKILRIQKLLPSISFPAIGTGFVRWGRSSGHTAVSLAVAMGATTIFLVGYDMRLIDGKSHHHSDYSTIAHPGVYEEFIDHFDNWDRSAKLAGVTIYNTSVNSYLNEFEKISFEEAVSWSVNLPFSVHPSEIGEIHSKHSFEDSQDIEEDDDTETKIIGHSSVPVSPHRINLPWLRRK